MKKKLSAIFISALSSLNLLIESFVLSEYLGSKKLCYHFYLQTSFDLSDF